MRAVAIVVHDVAPATLPWCRCLVDMVREIKPDAPLTQLVVPEFHHHHALTEHAQLRQWLDARLVHGDELALHGFYHVDEGAAPRTLASWLARRMLTAGEAEFSTLTAEQARPLIERGLAAFAECGWHANGFVPPAWQISTAARAVLSEFPFAYTSTTNFLWRLPEAAAYRVPALGFSARSGPRRWLSIKYNWLRLQQLRREPFIRIALHPLDAAYSTTLNAWRDIIAYALHDRVAVTKHALLAHVARHPQRDLLRA